MPLTDLAIPTMMDSSSSNLIADFFTPVLSASVRYDRGVGYFSSGWLRVAAEGMVQFATNGGRARWVTSPILDAEDWDAMRAGDLARRDTVLRQALRRNIEDLRKSLESDTLSALAWMVADGIIDFRLALPRNKLLSGDFHDKFGIFQDADGNRLSFNGSYNDSIQGLRNYESIKVFGEWYPAFAPLVIADAERFELLWNNQDPNVRTFDLPQAAHEQILRLRTQKRGYPRPEWVQQDAEDPQSMAPYALPAIPDSLTPRDYQSVAIDAWFKNDCRGLLEMATGSGKTITALLASVRLYEQQERLAVVVAVPYQHLVDQWDTEARRFGYLPILAYQNQAKWRADLDRQCFEFASEYRKSICVIATHATLTTSAFQHSLGRLTGPVMFIADEVHHMGAEKRRESYPQHIPFRMALSATPDRWFDEIGTRATRAYFGDTVFRFPLSKAIGVCLTPYEYHPHLVPLTDVEMGEYARLSRSIWSLTDSEEEDDWELRRLLLIKRDQLLNRATNKLKALSELIDAEPSLLHTLFYTTAGQIDPVIELLGWQKGLLVRRFTASETPVQRRDLLAEFASGRLQALVAMKCLDEGVDIPATRKAFILASSSNPREFVQRRGRLLRQSPGKTHAVIHDLIAMPPLAVAGRAGVSETERRVVQRELGRFREFANLAQNKHHALDVVWDLAKRYGLMDF